MRVAFKCCFTRPLPLRAPAGPRDKQTCLLMKRKAAVSDSALTGPSKTIALVLPSRVRGLTQRSSRDVQLASADQHPHPAAADQTSSQAIGLVEFEPRDSARPAASAARAPTFRFGFHEPPPRCPTAPVAKHEHGRARFWGVSRGSREPAIGTSRPRDRRPANWRMASACLIQAAVSRPVPVGEAGSTGHSSGGQGGWPVAVLISRLFQQASGLVERFLYSRSARCRDDSAPA